MLRRLLLVLFTTAAIFGMAACAAIGAPEPQTFNQKVAVGIASVTTVRQSATVLLNAGKISVDDAKNVQAQADTAMAGITIARSVGHTDQAAGQTKLNAALTILQALDAYLKSKGTP